MNTTLRLYGCSLFGLAQGKEEVDEEMFFVLLRRDKDEQKKKRIESMFLSNPVHVHVQGWWDEDVHVLGLVSYKGIHWRGGLRACSLFGWIHHGRKILIHWIARAAKCKLHTCFTTGYKWALNFKKWADERIARMFFVGLNGRSTSCKLHTCWPQPAQSPHLVAIIISLNLKRKEILKSWKFCKK